MSCVLFLSFAESIKTFGCNQHTHNCLFLYLDAQSCAPANPYVEYIIFHAIISALDGIQLRQPFFMAQIFALLVAHMTKLGAADGFILPTPCRRIMTCL